ncbi:MAG TPA: bifunctional riboflavin kinase/FAD synthetase [Acidimicrobiia bacterium]
MIVWQGHPDTWPKPEGPTSVTIGVFDGVHLGHRSLLSHLDRSFTATVLTFEPHPVEVLAPGTHPRLLTSIEERIELFGALGIEQVGVIDLADIRYLEPESFVTGILVEKLHAAQVVVGEDYRFGRDRAGDAGLLHKLGEQHGYETVAAPLMHSAGGVVSSTRIRNLIAEGRPEDASACLASLFRITGEVIEGDKRGRELGFPTANLAPPPRKVLPADGVYAGFAVVDGERLPAAINVGVRPTFGEGHRLIEAYILDFEGDLYGRTIAVEFAHWLRPEKRFDTVGDLLVQMRDDVDRTRVLSGSAVWVPEGGSIPPIPPLDEKQPRDESHI